MLECEVRVGRHNLVPRGEEKDTWTFRHWARAEIDSVYLDRGVCQTGAGKGLPAGNEWVIYSWDQVMPPRDPPPLRLRPPPSPLAWGSLYYHRSALPFHLPCSCLRLLLGRGPAEFPISFVLIHPIPDQVRVLREVKRDPEL